MGAKARKPAPSGIVWVARDQEDVYISPHKARPRIVEQRSSYTGAVWKEFAGMRNSMVACARQFQRVTGVALKPWEVKKVRITVTQVDE